MTLTCQALPPSHWVSRFATLIPPGGEVLDLACGQGRHARYLAGLGHRVEAVDRDEAALAALADVPGIHTTCADLEGGPWPYGGRIFTAIIVTRYLWRPLFPLLMANLAEGGVLIFETFMLGQEKYGKPSNPAFLLRPNELLEVTRRNLLPVAFEQGEIGAGDSAAVIQRLCAVRAPVGWQSRLPE